MDDKRLTKRLLDYWNRLRADGELPLWEKFNVASLADIWGQCCVWRVQVIGSERNINQYIYDYVGVDAQEALGKDLTGMAFVSHLERFAGARITLKMNEVVESRMPASDEGSFVNEKNKIVKYRSCLMPFGTRAGKVTHVVLGLSWRTF